jgi:hypothetical protein
MMHAGTFFLEHLSLMIEFRLSLSSPTLLIHTNSHPRMHAPDMSAAGVHASVASNAESKTAGIAVCGNVCYRVACCVSRRGQR